MAIDLSKPYRPDMEETPAPAASVPHHPGAMKFDGGKAPIHRGVFRYFARALFGVAHISGYGFDKYGSWGGWREVELDRYLDAKGRHLLTAEIPEQGLYDPESDYLHAAHEAWGALAKLDKMLEQGIPLRKPKG